MFNVSVIYPHKEEVNILSEYMYM